MNAVRVAAWGLVLTAGLFCAAASAQQQSPFGPTTAPASASAPVQNPPVTGYPQYFAVFQNPSESAQLAQQYVKATKEEDKREIRKKLTDLLVKQFDQQVQQQQKELEDLEKQIANLRALLKKRQDAKEKIVERRFEQLVQEAAGLGWQDGPPRAANQWEAARPYSPAKR